MVFGSLALCIGILMCTRRRLSPNEQEDGSDIAKPTEALLPGQKELSSKGVGLSTDASAPKKRDEQRKGLG